MFFVVTYCVLGRNLKHVTGRLSVEGSWKVNFPFKVLYTRIPPSPPPATKNCPSGENRILYESSFSSPRFNLGGSLFLNGLFWVPSTDSSLLSFDEPDEIEREEVAEEIEEIEGRVFSREDNKFLEEEEDGDADREAGWRREEEEEDLFDFILGDDEEEDKEGEEEREELLLFKREEEEEEEEETVEDLSFDNLLCGDGGLRDDGGVGVVIVLSVVFVLLEEDIFN